MNYDNRNPVENLRIRFRTLPENLIRYSPEGDGTIRREGAEAVLPVLRTWAVLVWEK